MCTPAVRLHLPPTARRQLLLRHQLRGLLSAQPPGRLNHQRQVRHDVQQDDLPPDQPHGLSKRLGTLGSQGSHPKCTVQMENRERSCTTGGTSLCKHISVGIGQSGTVKVERHTSRNLTIIFSCETGMEEQFGVQKCITPIVTMMSCTFKTMAISCSTSMIWRQHFGLQARIVGKLVDAVLF